MSKLSWVLKNQSRKPWFITFSAVAMDACKWWLFATQKGCRLLPLSLAVLCAREHLCPRPLEGAWAVAQGENNITLFSLQEKHKFLLEAYSWLLSAIAAALCHETLTPQGIQSPHRSYPVSVNCTSPSLHWSLSPFLSLETEGTRKRPNIQSSGSLNKHPVSREEYDYQRHSGNTVLGICSQASME